MSADLEFCPGAIAEVKQHCIVCPACGKPSGSIDHLNWARAESRWFCDHCGEGYAFKLTPGKVEVARTYERHEKTIVLLRHANILLVVEGTRFVRQGVADDDHDAYYYNEHTCPTNYMRQVKAVVNLGAASPGFVGDFDPHGIFEHVKTLTWDPRVDERNNDEFLQSILSAALQ